MPRFPREMALVNPELRDVFCRLARGDVRWPLFIYGPQGTGKTTAALTLCDWTACRRFTTAKDVSDVVFNAEHWIWRDVREADCLWVLDELGAREKAASDPHYDAIKQFVDGRELYGGRVAIYISNLDPKRLAGIYDDRLIDRITCGQVFELTGQSRRRD